MATFSPADKNKPPRLRDRVRPEPEQRATRPAFLKVEDAIKRGYVYEVHGVIRCLKDGVVLSDPRANGSTGAGCRRCGLVIGQEGDEP